jgi:hypothetical protein
MSTPKNSRIQHQGHQKPLTPNTTPIQESRESDVRVESIVCSLQREQRSWALDPRPPVRRWIKLRWNKNNNRKLGRAPRRPFERWFWLDTNSEVPMEEVTVNPQPRPLWQAKSYNLQVAASSGAHKIMVFPRDIFRSLVIHDFQALTERLLQSRILLFCKVSSRRLENYTRRKNRKMLKAWDWLHLYRVQRPEEVDLKYGDEGFQELLKSNVTPST